MDLLLPLGRERQRGADVLSLQIREVVEDLVLAHPSGDVLEDVVDGSAEATNARRPPRFLGPIVIRDRQLITRDRSVRGRGVNGQRRMRSRTASK